MKILNTSFSRVESNPKLSRLRWIALRHGGRVLTYMISIIFRNILENQNLSNIDPCDVPKMMKHSSEFSCRYNRVHLYQLQRQVSTSLFYINYVVVILYLFIECCDDSIIHSVSLQRWWLWVLTPENNLFLFLHSGNNSKLSIVFIYYIIQNV